MLGASGRRSWTATAGMAAGTVLGLHALPARVGIATGAVGCLLLAQRRSRAALLAGALLAGMSLGFVNAAVRRPEPGPLSALASRGQLCDVEGTVVEQAGGLGTIVSLKTLSCRRTQILAQPGAIVIDEHDAELGGTVTASGHLAPLSDDDFDDARRRLGAEAAFDATEMRTGEAQGMFERAAGAVRDGMRVAVRDIGAESGALLRGLSIGDTGGFDEAMEEEFRRAGLSHLVAVSGSNVAIVLSVFLVAARRLGAHLRLAAAAGGLVMYVLVVGPQPSVLRAASMGAVALLAIATGTRAAPLNALAIACAAVLAFKPQLVHQVGLQLSVAATAGIILWSSAIAERLRSLPQVVAIAAGVTLAAQIAVAPLVIGVFGQFSLTGPIANLLAAPAVAPATILGLGAAVVATVSPALATLPAKLAEPFAWWIATVAHHMGGSGAAVAAPGWVGWTLVAPVAAVAVVTLRRARTLRS